MSPFRLSILPLILNSARMIGLSLLLLQSGACQKTPQEKPAAVPIVKPRILRTLPHDTLAFTQGLLVHDTYLYESTGAPAGQISTLRRIDPANGAISKQIAVPSGFAEGIAVMGDRLVQLTWQDQFAFVYSMPHLVAVGRVPYIGEGWGLTTAANRYIMSNGSDTLTVRNERFEPVQKMQVTYQGVAVTNINELEYARQVIYANIWYATSIYVISPRTGAVIQVVDCSELIEREQPGSVHNVLNGIAWNRESDLFYLTGKNWKTLFEVTLPAPPHP